MPEPLIYELSSPGRVCQQESRGNRSEDVTQVPSHAVNREGRPTSPGEAR